MRQNCCVIQTVHQESSVVYFGTEAECADWILGLPDAIQKQFLIWTVL